MQDWKYFLARVWWRAMSLLPLWAIHLLADFAYWVMYRLVGYRKGVVRGNLSTAFPEKSPEERLRIEKKFYRYLCDTFLESLKLSHWSEKKMKKHMAFLNSEEVAQHFAAGRSVTFFLGHYGNWEWISSMKIWLEGDFAGGQIYKRLHNELFDRLMIENRSKFGVECIEMQQTLRHIVECQRAGRVSGTGYIADQSPSKQDSKYFVPFLNRKVPVITGAERITKRFGFEAYYVDVKRIRRGYWQARFIKMHDDPKSLEDYKLTEIFYQMLSRTIQRQPEYYLWSHNRFKNAID